MKKYFAIALAVLAVAGCRNRENDEPVPAGLIRVEPLITKATEVNFEDGDKIGLTVVTTDGDYADNKCLTYAGEEFSGDLLWYANVYSESSLYAYYPYADAGTPTSYNLPADQTSGIGAADFMAAAKEGVLPTANAVTMVFKHMMTKLVINVDNQSGAEINSVEILGGAHTATLDLKALTVTAGAVAEDAAVKAFNAGEGKKWQAIVVPQKVALKISFTLSNNKIITQPLAEMTLKSGGQYTVNARVLPDNVEVTATGEILNWTDEGYLAFEGEAEKEYTPVTFEEFEGYFVYDGVRYNTVKLADGNTWMAQNLRFVPRGRAVSSNPAEDAGIWYPAANADAVADPDLAETLGLLYDAATAFGVEAITEANAGTFEGCQGICPTGWHVPTVTDMTGLVGHSSNSALVNPAGAYYDATINGASLTALKQAGWEWQFAGIRTKGNTTATGKYQITNYDGIYGVMSYGIGSTMHQVQTNDDGSLKNVQYHYLMPLYNASYEKLSVSYGGFLYGASLRCVKNR